MANFKKAFDVLMKLEFNSPSNYLHKHDTERDYTVAGIYKYAHPNWLGWFIVGNALERKKGDIYAASRELYKSTHLTELVMQFYLEHFWSKMRLNDVHNDNTATELFIFATNSGTRNAIRKAQKLIDVTADGLVGPQTLRALNEYDPHEFDMKFDEVEKQFYADIIAKKPSFEIFKNGWNKRAEYV